MRALRNLKQRYPVAFGLIVGTLVAAGAAGAAWFVFTGAQGSGGAKVGTSQISPAITLTNTGLTGITAVVPGTPGTVKANIVNNASVSETINTLTDTITASPSCDTSALHYTFGGPYIVPANATENDVPIGTITADANLDPACSGATLTLNLTGTTSP